MDQPISLTLRPATITDLPDRTFRIYRNNLRQWPTRIDASEAKPIFSFSEMHPRCSWLLTISAISCL
jgi:hypothetical protein